LFRLDTQFEVEEMSTAERAVCTPEELLEMTDGDLYELVDGQLVERKMSALSSWVAGETYGRIRDYLRDTGRGGWAFPEGTSYQCFAWDPGAVRRADASYVAAGRFDNDEVPEQGHLRIAPDLAAEVVSPHDSFNEVDQKVEDFLEAGVRLVWVISPETRSVQIYRAGEQATRRLHADDELDAEDILPGFRCKVSDLFPTGASTTDRDAPQA
jgi:Uma2 family endonuclease